MRLARWWRSLDHPRDLPILVGMQAWVLWLLVARRFRSLQQLLARLRPPGASGRRASDERCASLVRYARFVVWLDRLFIRNPCLYECLLLYRYLRLEGRQAEIAFGVRPEGDALEGHAWVLLDGRPLTASAEDVGRYEPLWTTDGVPATGHEIPVDIRH
jgi:hypothetical protein